MDPTCKGGRPRIRARGRDALLFGADEVDLRALEQIADPSQVRAVGALLARVALDGPEWLDDPVSWLAERLQQPWEAITARPVGDLARPRLAELMGALNRLRSARFES